MAQIIRITSEALQATIRRLLPSQQGFGEDLQASNVIQPIIDLTPTAEGSILRQDLQSALNHGGNTAFSINSTTTAIANTPGFWRVTGTCTLTADGAGVRRAEFQITDGTTSKIMWAFAQNANTGNEPTAVSYDLVFFLDSGDTLNGFGQDAAQLRGSARQIATITGDLVNPVGYVSQ